MSLYPVVVPPPAVKHFGHCVQVDLHRHPRPALDCSSSSSGSLTHSRATTISLLRLRLCFRTPSAPRPATRLPPLAAVQAAPDLRLHPSAHGLVLPAGPAPGPGVGIRIWIRGHLRAGRQLHLVAHQLGQLGEEAQPVARACPLVQVLERKVLRVVEVRELETPQQVGRVWTSGSSSGLLALHSDCRVPRNAP